MLGKWKKLLLITAIMATLLLLAACNQVATSTPVESWLTEDGQLAEPSNDRQVEEQWGVWLPTQTFGRVLDFSTEGSYMQVSDSAFRTDGEFAVSAWILAPIREKGDRVILIQGDMGKKADLGGIRLYLDGSDGHNLAFQANGLQPVENSGVSLVDGKWHHVLVSCSGKKLTYYIDGQNVKTVSLSGNIRNDSKTLIIGADTAGESGFDGSIAEVRLFHKSITPEQATDTVLNEKDNKKQKPRLNLKEGIVLDRRQYHTPEPSPSEGQTVTEDDIINCINMGFDHVKLLLTPNHLIDEDGSLITENMAYITRVIDCVEKNNYRCILCIHPEDDFKLRYLKNLDNFEELVKWYGELAAYIGEHWDADTVALQLMTEPADNSLSVSWSWMSDRAWGAVRNVLPEHTILTSSDRYGNLEQLKLMSPATDPNLIYTFTTYEPYTIGWCYYNVNYGQLNAWSYVHDIPYPVEEGVDYTAAIENAIDQVPEQWKEEIRQQLTAYVKGEYDGLRADMVNNYDSLYNTKWHILRAKSLDEWSKKYGGNIHMMCVEFGCMDAQTPANLWQSAAPGYGNSDETRLRFIQDMRMSFEKFDIGWSYWSYNEAYTVFKTSQHSYGMSPSPDVAVRMFDFTLLTEGLGVKPLVEPVGSGAEEVIDPSWLVIDTFESAAIWFGTDLEFSYDDPASGSGSVFAKSKGSDDAYVFSTKCSPGLDITAYEDGYAHIWIYVEDVSKLQGGQVELCSGSGPDIYETSWEIKQYVTQNGWNEVYLPLAEAGQGAMPAMHNNIGYIRIFFLTDGSCRVGLDTFYLCHEKQEPQNPGGNSASLQILNSVEDAGAWYGSNLKLRTDAAPAGAGWVMAADCDGSGASVFSTTLPTMDLSGFAEGYISMWIYVEDVSKLQGGQLEITSSGGADVRELSWEIVNYVTQNGWNQVKLPMAEANVVAGGADLTRINYIRFYTIVSDYTPVGIDEISAAK